MWRSADAIANRLNRICSQFLPHYVSADTLALKYQSIHTFSRDMKRNFHIHLSSTAGSLSLTYDSWLRGTCFYHESLRKTWRYRIIALLREEFKKGCLKLSPSLKYITSYLSVSFRLILR